MRELFQRIFTSARWFIGFVIVLTIIWLFVWRAVDHDGFINSMNDFLRHLWELFGNLLTLALVVMGMAVMFGWRPFRRRGGGGGHH